MAISPPSDIVLDVARAVDPAGMAAAKLQLEKRSQSVASVAATFPEVGQKNMAGARFASDNIAGKTDAASKTYKKFEAVVLQTFMKSMMPKDTEAVFGKGLAGDMWKSELAQQLGTVLADRGGIGIANRLLKAHHKSGDHDVPLTGASDGARKADADLKKTLSVALVQEMQRKLTSPIGAGSPPADTKI